jgi:hypothetical protein
VPLWVSVVSSGTARESGERRVRGRRDRPHEPARRPAGQHIAVRAGRPRRSAGLIRARARRRSMSRSRGAARDSRASSGLSLFRSAAGWTDEARAEPVVALEPVGTEQALTVGHVSHDAQARVNRRVTEVLARREATRTATGRAPEAPVTEVSTAAPGGGLAINSRSSADGPPSRAPQPDVETRRGRDADGCRPVDDRLRTVARRSR